MSTEETPTPSEIRGHAAKALPQNRVDLLESIMSDIDGMVHRRRDELTLESVDGDVGALAAAVTSLAAVLHAELEREE